VFEFAVLAGQQAGPEPGALLDGDLGLVVLGQKRDSQQRVVVLADRAFVLVRRERLRSHRGGLDEVQERDRTALQRCVERRIRSASLHRHTVLERWNRHGADTAMPDPMSPALMPAAGGSRLGVAMGNEKII
jgi:hypothetical protein